MSDQSSCKKLVSCFYPDQQYDSLIDHTAVDAYRDKMCSAMAEAQQDVSCSSPHLEFRIGKRKWVDYGRIRPRSRSG